MTGSRPAGIVQLVEQFMTCVVRHNLVVPCDTDAGRHRSHATRRPAAGMEIASSDLFGQPDLT
jgi:hypothetical protein